MSDRMKQANVQVCTHPPCLLSHFGANSIIFPKNRPSMRAHLRARGFPTNKAIEIADFMHWAWVEDLNNVQRYLAMGIWIGFACAVHNEYGSDDDDDENDRPMDGFNLSYDEGYDDDDDDDDARYGIQVPAVTERRHRPRREECFNEFWIHELEFCYARVGHEPPDMMARLKPHDLAFSRLVAIAKRVDSEPLRKRRMTASASSSLRSELDDEVRSTAQSDGVAVRPSSSSSSSSFRKSRAKGKGKGVRSILPRSSAPKTDEPAPVAMELAASPPTPITLPPLSAVLNDCLPSYSSASPPHVAPYVRYPYPGPHS